MNNVIENGEIGMYLGYKIIEDDSVTELRLPKKVIDLFKSNKFVEAKEYA